MTRAPDGLSNAKPYRFTYADAATREADTSVTANDVGSLAYQEDAGSFWILETTTPTWNPASGAAGDMLAANNLSDLTSASTARTNLGLGTAAVKNVPASGNAASGEAVLGSDTRLTDSRTPTGHHASHEVGGSDAFTGIVPGSAFAPAGLTGATAASRYVGATASGAPASGTFAVGDFVIDQTGKAWVCTSAGSPGTWAQLGSGGGTATFTGVRATTNATQSIPNATFTTLAWPTEDFDTDGFHDTTTNTSRLTVPTGLGGKYLITCEIALSSGGSYIEMQILKNGVSSTPIANRNQAPSAGFNTYLAFTVGPITLAAADYVEVTIYQNSGGSLSTVSALLSTCYCSLWKVG